MLGSVFHYLGHVFRDVRVCVSLSRDIIRIVCRYLGILGFVFRYLGLSLEMLVSVFRYLWLVFRKVKV